MTHAADRTLARLRAANPVPEGHVPELVEAAWSESLLTRVLAEPLPTRARRSSPKRRLVLVAAVLAVLAAAPAYALGRSVVDWVLGDPAPPEVVADFAEYAPQLGFDPQPGKAVLVAEDGEIRLYVTANEQGTYCFALSTRRDGGTCVPPAVASAPVVAGFAGTASGPAGERRLVVVGRVRAATARTVRFTAPGGEPAATRVGVGGFFVASVPATSSGAACSGDGWAPTFAFADASGDRVAEATIRLATARGSGPELVCTLVSMARAG